MEPGECDNSRYFADAAVTAGAGNVSKAASMLAQCAESAFRKGAQVARAGQRVCGIGRAVEHETRRSGFRVLRDLRGHGAGRTIHEEPTVPNYSW
jgi:methionyl aminopeptidase